MIVEKYTKAQAGQKGGQTKWADIEKERRTEIMRQVAIDGWKKRRAAKQLSSNRDSSV